MVVMGLVMVEAGVMEVGGGGGGVCERGVSGGGSCWSLSRS